MGRQVETRVIFGFKTDSVFDNEADERLYQHGIMTSPLVWSLEAPRDSLGTIVGIKIVTLSGTGDYKEINFDSSEENKAKLKKELYKKLDEAGFDVSDKECKLYINTYFGH